MQIILGGLRERFASLEPPEVPLTCEDCSATFPDHEEDRAISYYEDLDLWLCESCAERRDCEAEDRVEEKEIVNG